MKYILRKCGKESGSHKKFECINSLIVHVIEEIKNLSESEYDEIKIEIEDN